MSSQASSKGDADVETGPPSSLEGVDLDILGATQGYILDEKQLCEHAGLNPYTNLKTASNGVVLVPQPSEDPQDPLNWSRWKKAGILLVIVSNAFTADYTAATGASAVVPQAIEWHMSPTTVIHATAGYAQTKASELAQTDHLIQDHFHDRFRRPRSRLAKRIHRTTASTFLVLDLQLCDSSMDSRSR